jgi:Zn-dependent metalloprotease
MPLIASVHYGKNYDNAFWNGQQMVFGDGDNVIFSGFTRSTDVIGHELTHGVTGSEANLTYQGQPGALNESISDVFGSMVKQYKLKQTADKADWLIGAGILAKGIQGVALRSMKAPGTAYDDPKLGKDPQPAEMAHYVRTGEDNGGVHINSGIPNRAFYLVASALGGHSWEKAGQIWYDTLVDHNLKPNASFATFANLTIHNAGSRYGAGGTEQKAVADAWAKVGVHKRKAGKTAGT